MPEDDRVIVAMYAALGARQAAEAASAALREALSLAGVPAERLGDQEVEALFALLRQIDRQSVSLEHALSEVKADYLGSGADRRRALREELILLRAQLSRLHVAASLAHTPARAGADAARSRVETIQVRVAEVERLAAAGKPN